MCELVKPALGIEPGDNIKKLRLLAEFSLTQLTFKTHEQYRLWKEFVDRQKISGKQSLEAYFLNNDGTVDFKRLVEWTDDAVARGVVNPVSELDPNRHAHRESEINEKGKKKGGKEKQASRNKNTRLNHPNLKAYEAIRAELSNGNSDVHSSIEEIS